MATFTKKDSFLAAKPGAEWKDEYSNYSQFAHGYYDDDYLNEIAQYKDKPWYDQLLTNPWLAGNQSAFSPTWWQSTKEDMFQDYSARDAYNADLTSRRSEWLSNFLEQIRQQDYNSPAAQVEREKAAGLNPDLNPSSIGPGEASENDQPINGGVPMMHDDSDLQTIWNIGSSMIGTIFSVASSMQGLVAGHLENKLKKLETSESNRSFAKDLIKDSLTEYYNGLDHPELIENVFENGDFMDGLTKNLSQAVDKSDLSHADKKRMRKIIDGIIYNEDGGTRSYTNNFQKMVHDSVAELRKSRNERVQASALPGSLEGDSDVLDFISHEVYKPIIDAELATQKLKLKYSHEYLSTPGLGRSQGEAEKAQYEIQKGMLGIKEKLLKSFEEINKKITGNRNLSPSWKIALQAGLASAEAFSFSKLGFNK